MIRFWCGLGAITSGTCILLWAIGASIWGTRWLETGNWRLYIPLPLVAIGYVAIYFGVIK